MIKIQHQAELQYDEMWHTVSHTVCMCDIASLNNYSGTGPDALLFRSASMSLVFVKKIPKGVSI